MPRKVTGEKLEKVISTKIPTKKFELFEKYSRQYYIQNKIKQPTVSALLRALINGTGWLPGKGGTDRTILKQMHFRVNHLNLKSDLNT
ncbi:MAG: hypothetical protein WCE25_08105 [Nitrososphaeraceae archaeon]